MIADNDHRTGAKIAVWPIVLAAILGLGFVGSILATFLIGYLSIGDPPPDLGHPSASPAWQRPLQPGDKITKIDEREMCKFRDLQESVTLGDLDDGFSIKVERPDSADGFQPAGQEVEDIENPPGQTADEFLTASRNILTCLITALT